MQDPQAPPPIRSLVLWPRETAGVAVDPATGDVFMVVPGQGIWKSGDQGKTFARADNGAIGGRCETSYALQFDPAGRRLACFMLDGKCAMTADGGTTWTAFTGLGRNWDAGAGEVGEALQTPGLSAKGRSSRARRGGP